MLSRACYEYTPLVLDFFIVCIAFMSCFILFAAEEKVHSEPHKKVEDVGLSFRRCASPPQSPPHLPSHLGSHVEAKVVLDTALSAT